ncbi:hypothetical protein BASA50_003333 [Batrachochytrium salamandrivorans]|uniref:Uncharacterized protein n=1 Tax=Batrachochytrium salamandrivorans TaxID=1357716 RepID=A0ABQ8FLZ7_9FUNG|nr:hypothetical protein BASA50_003333 [Batrachochytrium salamandrivorans]
MQFFYLLSFAVVASHAAALPQPAGLSEKYSNNVDNNLASGLEARSYQPESNFHKDSPTLMSLERRAGSAGSPKGSTVFGTQPLSTLSPEEAKKLIDSVFKPSDFSFVNLSSTIEKVGDGAAEISENGEKVGTKIVGAAGALLARYLRKAAYVNLALTVSAGSGLKTIMSFIEATTPPDDSFEVFSDFVNTFEELTGVAETKERESDGSIVNILKDTGNTVQNAEVAIQSLVDALASLVKLFDAIKTLMGKSESGKAFYDGISTTIESLVKFSAEQQKLRDEIITALRATPSQ